MPDQGAKRIDRPGNTAIAPSEVDLLRRNRKRRRHRLHAGQRLGHAGVGQQNANATPCHGCRCRQIRDDHPLALRQSGRVEGVLQGGKRAPGRLQPGQFHQARHGQWAKRPDRHQAQLFAAEQACLQAGVGHGTPQQNKIMRTRTQAAGKELRRVDRQLQGDGGMALANALYDATERRMPGDPRDQSQADGSARFGSLVGRRGATEVLGHAQQGLGLYQQGVAHRSQVQAPPATIEQVLAEITFQSLELPSQGGLGDGQPAGRLGDSTATGDDDEGAEVLEVEHAREGHLAAGSYDLRGRRLRPPMSDTINPASYASDDTNPRTTQSSATRSLPMSTTIFLAGASGAIGRRLAPMLVERGWLVFGTTRKADRMKAMQDAGVEPLLVDVFDRDLLGKLLRDIRPNIVMHQLTDLPYALEASQMTAALVRNARIRDEGTRNLVAAAAATNCRRIIAQSLGFIYDEGLKPHAETDPLLPDSHPTYGATAVAVRSLESQVLGSASEGIVLRYGLFYGPGTGFDQPIAPGSVHVDAAAQAAVLAVTGGQSGIYNIAEDDGQVSIAKALRDLAWNPGWRA